jgi:cytidylate kinase
MDETEITNKGTLADQSRNVLIKLQLANEILKELAEKDDKDLNREQRQLRLAIALMMEGTQNLKIPGDGTE